MMIHRLRSGSARIAHTAWTRLRSRTLGTDPRAHQRGQVIPSALLFLPIILLISWFLIDTAGVQNVAGRAVTGALRAGGLAALGERGTVDEYGRWYVCPPTGQGLYSADGSCDNLDGEAIAREYVAQNMVGDSGLGDGGYTSIFGSEGGVFSTLTTGTNNNTTDGLDVEILNPAAQDGQTSEAFFNGSAISATPQNGGNFPECLESLLLPGQCFDTATVVLHIRMPARHVVGTFGTIDTTIVVRAGTDANG